MVETLGRVYATSLVLVSVSKLSLAEDASFTSQTFEVSSSRSDKVPELVKDMSAEVRSKMFSEMITSSVQDQAVKKVSQELDNETDTCDRYQDEKVGSSAV